MSDDGSLGDHQRTFAALVPRLIDQALALGYAVTLGEAWRPAATAALDAQQGIGIAHSLHTLRCALDLNLFKDGVYLTATDAYAPLGTWWEQQHPDAAWGGRFTRADGNHFSLSWDGVR